MKLDILAFGAHPDDIEISCAGTLISEARKGKKIGLVDLTRGEMGTRGTVEIRDQEAIDAAKIIGAVVRENLGLPDTRFVNDDETKAKVIGLIRKYQPEIVITNAPHDRHPDHGRAATLVVESCFLAGLQKWQMPGIPANPWRPKCVYQYMQFYQNPFDFVYDISDTMEEKLESIRAHRSQFWDPKSQEPETLIASKHFFDNITSRASEYGIQAGFSYGEPFIAVRPIGLRDLSELY